MSFMHCDDCGFLYENINFCSCPICRELKEMKEPTSPFVKGKKLSEYTEEERKQIVAQSKHEFSRKPGFFDNMHISYAQNKIDQGWLDFHGQEDEYNYPLPTCAICDKELGIGDFRDGHHPYHQEYNACKEHKDECDSKVPSGESPVRD